MTTRISKACHECRARKIRCNGDQPCQHCTARGSHCAYRAKARTRLRRGAKPPGNVASPVANEIEHIGYKAAEPSPNDVNDVDRAINTHSVAATHRASPSCLLQLYYGPSSMFSLMHSIYHQIEGTRPNSPTRQGVEEIGPGLDLFSHRRLFFGDLADTQPSRSRSDDYSGIFLEMDTARRFLERYLATYWFGLPVMPKDEHRHRLSNLLRPPALFDFDSAENIIIVLSMAIGAHMLGEDATSDFLYQKAKQGIAKLDEAVNVQMVQVYLLMGQLQLERASPNSGFLHIGTAVRRAVAVGLHKEAGGRAGDGQQEIDQRRTTFWALYFWETWYCFALGRPSSIPEPRDSIPVPKNQRLLQSMVNLSRIISKCSDRIYAPRHDSLLPVWNFANEIRVELRQFAEQQPQAMGFSLVGDIKGGELGLCQAMLSTMYHHTLQLTFRPFLILRAKLKKKYTDAGISPQKRPSPPPWLDKACGYCLEAAKSVINFLVGACRENVLCREIQYHNFFIEGSCYILAFDLMQDKEANHHNLHWIRLALQCLRSMLPSHGGKTGQVPTTIVTIERMVRAVIPDFRVEATSGSSIHPVSSQQGFDAGTVAMPSADGYGTLPGGPGPPRLYGTHGSGQSQDQSETLGEELGDFTAADVGLDFDFGTMDMDAFLSIDPNQDWGFRW